MNTVGDSAILGVRLARLEVVSVVDDRPHDPGLLPVGVLLGELL